MLKDCLSVKSEKLSSGQCPFEAAYELREGHPVPEGAHLVHLCDNDDCCNPAHVWYDTTDRLKGVLLNPDVVYTPAKGEDNVNAKLTEEDVKMIAELLLSGVTQRPISRRFGVTQQTISQIARGITWTEVTGFKRRTDEDTWNRLTGK